MSRYNIIISLIQIILVMIASTVILCTGIMIGHTQGVLDTEHKIYESPEYVEAVKQRIEAENTIESIQND